MLWSKESQERWRSGATIFSLIAVPIILGVGGWLIQRQVAEEGVKQQYVQLAVDVLRNADKEDDELREWAVNVVDEYAPFPLPSEAKVSYFPGGTSSRGLFAQYPLEPFQVEYYVAPNVCAQYFVITDDKEGFEQCVVKARENKEEADNNGSK